MLHSDYFDVVDNDRHDDEHGDNEEHSVYDNEDNDEDENADDIKEEEDDGYDNINEKGHNDTDDAEILCMVCIKEVELKQQIKKIGALKKKERQPKKK